MDIYIIFSDMFLKISKKYFSSFTPYSPDIPYYFAINDITINRPSLKATQTHGRQLIKSFSDLSRDPSIFVMVTFL